MEDDNDIRELICFFLKKNGISIAESFDGRKGLDLVKTYHPHIIILDLMLPSLDGISITKKIREEPNIYGNPKIIMLTAKTNIDDVLEGLGTGADDYMKKPFDPRELILRIKKLTQLDEKISLKRHTFNNITIDEDKHLVLQGDSEVFLSKKEYDLLLLFIINKGLVLSREKILNKVWNSTYYSGDRTVDIYVSKLREKIKSISNNLKTIKGVGYKLDEKISS